MKCEVHARCLFPGFHVIRHFRKQRRAGNAFVLTEHNGNGASAWLPGLNWRIGWEIGFGSEINAIFDKSCGTSFDFAGQEEAAGKRIVVYLLAVS